MRPPQKVSSPVIRTRRPTAQPNQTLRRARSMSYSVVLEQRADPLGLVHHRLLEYAVLIGFHVEGDGVEHPELELGREVGHRAQDGAEDQHGWR